MSKPTIVSLTPAVFHLPDSVNAVARSYGVQPIVPRGPRFAPLLAKVKARLVAALDAPAYEAILMTGTGSTAMAAVLGSCLAQDETLLVIRNGAYGDRLVELAKRLGHPLVDYELPYGELPKLDRIEALVDQHDVKAIAIVYGATSTCSVNPVAEVGSLAKRRGLKFLVDGVSALFVEPFDFEAWGISAVMGSCNKGLHSHPNLTFALLHRDLADALEGLPQRVPSLELAKHLAAQRKGAHPYTIDPMSLLMVDAALDALEQEGGVEGRRAIYLARAELLRAGYEKLGLSIMQWEGMPLSTIGTALAIPAGTTYPALAERLASDVVDDHLFEIYAAQGKLSDRMFRVFHMGHYPLSAYEVFLRALGKALG